MTRDVGYKSAPIDPNFLSKPDQYPVTGEHSGHKVRAQGMTRMDGEGKPYPTSNGIHGTQVAIDWESCVPVQVLETPVVPQHVHPDGLEGEYPDLCHARGGPDLHLELSGVLHGLEERVQ